NSAPVSTSTELSVRLTPGLAGFSNSISTRNVPISFGIVAPEGTPSSTIAVRTVSIAFCRIPNLQSLTVRVKLPGMRSAAVGLLLCPALLAGQEHQRVDIGGRHLDVSRMGAGAPTIVFEVGLADSLNTWLPVATAAAELTSVVLYSRAGFGRSDPSSPSPDGYGARHAASDLHELLRRLALRPPFVLVGRSYGGLLVRLYTSLYPSDVAGLVLVDGTHERQVKEFGRIDSTYPAAFRASFDSVLKTVPPGAEAEEIRETVRIQAAGAVEGMAPLPDIPLAVLTSMKSDSNASYVN